MRPEHDATWGMGWLSRNDLLPWMDEQCGRCPLFNTLATAVTQAGECCYSWWRAEELCYTEEKYVSKYERWRREKDVNENNGLEELENVRVNFPEIKDNIKGLERFVDI